MLLTFAFQPYLSWREGPQGHVKVPLTNGTAVSQKPRLGVVVPQVRESAKTTPAALPPLLGGNCFEERCLCKQLLTLTQRCGAPKEGLTDLHSLI